MRYAVFPVFMITGMRVLHLFFCFNWLLSCLVFFVMKNIGKVELINATETCLLNCFSRGLDIIWINILYKILSNELELKIIYQQNVSAGKKSAILF